MGDEEDDDFRPRKGKTEIRKQMILLLLLLFVTLVHAHSWNTTHLCGVVSSL